MGRGKPHITGDSVVRDYYFVLEFGFYDFNNSIITFVGLQSFLVNSLTVAQIPPAIIARTPNAVTPVSPAFFLQAEHIPVLFFPTMVLPHRLHFLSLLFVFIINILHRDYINLLVFDCLARVFERGFQFL